jgi:hypothetical protein
MARINEVGGSTINKVFRNYIGIHEHDFISIRTEEEKSIVCLTCGSLYCEKCGKSVTIIHKNYMSHNIYN